MIFFHYYLKGVEIEIQSSFLMCPRSHTSEAGL